MDLIILYMLTSYIVGFHCFGKSDHEDATVICTNRFEYRMELKKQNSNCSQVIKLNPMCGKNIIVGYEIHPPYVYKDNGSIAGIIPGKLFLYLFVFRGPHSLRS